MALRGLFMRNREYLFLIPFALLIGFNIFFHSAAEVHQNELLNAKMADKRESVNLITASIDGYAAADKDWDTYDYLSVLARLAERMDQAGDVYAAVYDEDFHLMSERFMPEFFENERGRLFDPRQFADFLTRAAASGDGTLTLPYDRGTDTEPIYIYFQWAPSDPSYNHRLLFCVGLSADSVRTRPQAALTIGMVSLIGVTFLLNVLFVTMITGRQRALK